MTLSRRMLFGAPVSLAVAASLLRPVQAAMTPLWEQISTSGVLRVGVIANRPPYIVDDGNGGYKGFSITMAQDLAAALTVAMGKPIRIDYHVTTWPTAVLDVQSDRMDIFFGFAFSPERAQALDLVGPLYAVPEVAVLARGHAGGGSWADFDKPGTTIAAAMGTTDEQAARKYLPNATIRAMKNFSDAVMEVQSGQSVALVTSAIIGVGTLSGGAALGAVRVLTPIVSGPSGGGVRKDGDGKFFAFCQGFAWVYRTSGRSKEVILAAMKEEGMAIDALPKDITF